MRHQRHATLSTIFIPCDISSMRHYYTRLHCMRQSSIAPIQHHTTLSVEFLLSCSCYAECCYAQCRFAELRSHNDFSIYLICAISVKYCLTTRKAMEDLPGNLQPVQSGKSYRRGRLSTVDLLVKIACTVKKSVSKAAGLNQLVQGGRLY